jgi:diadenosine tetraphosphatase ApaH/serine/threonine PP2A family protein phosphatase
LFSGRYDHKTKPRLFGNQFMRILVISDIHANITALEGVLKAAGEIDAVWCLGDIVGYGPDPNECVARVRNLPNLQCIIGNHDAAALMQIDADTFNPEARNAIIWTRRQLSQASLEFLENLPERLEIGEVTLTHGSPRHPVWEYLLDTHAATINFDYFDTPLCFVGHTHLPVLYSLDGDNYLAYLSVPEPQQKFKLPARAIINPGSVGQPRDRDPRASFAIFDDESRTWEYQRIAYDINVVQARMRRAGLPDRHVQRLAAGW